MQLKSGIIPPKLNQERVLQCVKCGTIFMGKLFFIPARCPRCGSFSVKEDKRVLY